MNLRYVFNTIKLYLNIFFFFIKISCHFAKSKFRSQNNIGQDVEIMINYFSIEKREKKLGKQTKVELKYL